MNKLLEPVQKMLANEEFKKLKALAYPDDEPKIKKVKEKKCAWKKKLTHTYSESYDCSLLYERRGRLC